MSSFKTNRIIFAAGALIIGLILLIWPSTSLMVMAKCIGALLAAGGLAAAYFYYKDHDTVLKSVLLIMAAIMLICGIVIFIHPDELVKLIPTIAGVLVIISGLINLGETFLLNRQKYGRWWVSLIVSVLTIAAGLFVVSKAFSLASLITRIAGGVLVFDGLSDLWVTSRLSASADGSNNAGQPGPKPAPEPAAAPQPAPESVQQPEPVKTEKAPQPSEETSGQPAAEPEASRKHEADPAQGPADEIVLSFGGEDENTEKKDGVPEYLNQPEQDTEYHAPTAQPDEQ